MKLSVNRKVIITLLKPEGSHFNKYEHIWNKYETELTLRINSEGRYQALRLYKDSYEFLRNYLMQLPTTPIPFCRVDKQGIPKTLWSLRPLLKGNRNELRLALTIARGFERIHLPIDHCLESITSSAPIGGDTSNLTLEFEQFLEIFKSYHSWYFGTLQKLNGDEREVFTTLSKGPNGPAVSCAHLDAKAVVSEPSLYSSIKDLNSVLQQDWITKWMESQACSFTSNEKYLTGRLGFSSEPGGKTRIFAIADYWTQCSLKVIQISLYNTLKSISTDCTKDQNKGFQSLLRNSLHKETYCFDLSAASDRIPARMQRKRLELLGGKKLGEHWLSVMTERDFYVKDLKTFVRWKVGQPLGLLSSFPSFALWHHDIIQFAYNRERIKDGKPPKFFKQYSLLGDDVVIFDRKVANAYQDLMNKIGIPINFRKSVFGINGKSQIEFTKRLALNGIEMSSIKTNILLKNNIINMLDLVDILIERDFISQKTEHHEFTFLSSKENEKLNFLLWARSGTLAPFEIKGNQTYLISRESYNQKVKEKRSESLRSKTELLDKYLCRQKPIDTYFKAHAVPYDARALGLIDYNNQGELHPLVWAINQIGLELSDTLSRLWDDESLDVAPVEYLPLISLGSFFAKPRSRSEYISKIILETYEEFIAMSST